MSPHAAHWREALRALDYFLGWRGGWMPITYGGDKRTWHRCMDGRALCELVRVWEERWSEEMLLGLPWPSMDAGGPTGATALWCRIEGKDQLERARRFRPLPSVVLQEGASSRRLLIWGLSQWLGYFDVEKANRRIAYRLRAVQKHGVPENFAAPAPGTFLRVGRSRPTPVVVGRLEPDLWTVNQVAGRLKDPPPQRMPWEVAA